jgi:hypothetical protein
MLKLVIWKLRPNFCHVRFSICGVECLKCLELGKVFLAALLDVLMFVLVPINTLLMVFSVISQLPKPSLAVAG